MPFDPPLTVQEVAQAFGERYSAVRVLSSGGQGAVFRATYQTGRGESSEVALKVYFPDHLEARAAREVGALRRLRVSSIARLHASGKIGLRGRQCFYLATQYIEGVQLCDVIRTGPQAHRFVVQLGDGIAGAIAAIWNERIVHRDIKPANIIVAAAGGAVLIDLGVARHMALDSITTAGSTWGTHGYMSPEQARGRRQLSCKSDVFSLGVVLQETLAGHHPTHGDQIRLAGGSPPTVLSARSCPPDLAGIVDSMVQLRPDRRPSPAEAQRALNALRAGSS